MEYRKRSDDLIQVVTSGKRRGGRRDQSYSNVDNNENVTHKMFSWDGLGFIASAVGKPKRLHPDMVLCKSFACVCGG